MKTLTYPEISDW